MGAILSFGYNNKVIRISTAVIELTLLVLKLYSFNTLRNMAEQGDNVDDEVMQLCVVTVRNLAPCRKSKTPLHTKRALLISGLSVVQLSRKDVYAYIEVKRAHSFPTEISLLSDLFQMRPTQWPYTSHFAESRWLHGGHPEKEREREPSCPTSDPPSLFSFLRISWCTVRRARKS